MNISPAHTMPVCSPAPSLPAAPGDATTHATLTQQHTRLSASAASSSASVGQSGDAAQGDMQTLLGMMLLAWLMGGPEAVNQLLDLLTDGGDKAASQPSGAGDHMHMQTSAVQIEMTRTSGRLDVWA